MVWYRAISHTSKTLNGESHARLRSLRRSSQKATQSTYGPTEEAHPRCTVQNNGLHESRHRRPLHYEGTPRRSTGGQALNAWRGAILWCAMLCRVVVGVGCLWCGASTVQVRAGIAMAAALREAKRRGCTCLITGDGADELFSAFEFLSGMSEEKAYQCRKHVQETMRFPVVDLARAMGIQVRQPFLHPSVREFALALTKSELQCEGHDLLASWASKFAESKLLLRLAFPEVEAAQRRSDAIEVSGTHSLNAQAPAVASLTPPSPVYLGLRV